MIRIGNSPLTLFVGEASVKEAYFGATRIYPDKEAVITVEYSEWVTHSLLLLVPMEAIPASGGSVRLANADISQTRTKTTLADGVPISVEQEEREIRVTPTLSSNDAWVTISGNTVSGGSRGMIIGGTLQATITGTYDGVSGSCRVHQEGNSVTSYNYQVVALSGGSTIAWEGGSTTVNAKSQRTTTYTSGATSGYEDTAGQSISAVVSGPGFTIGPPSSAAGVYYFTVTAERSSPGDQRTGTVTFTGVQGGSATATVRQEKCPYHGEFRYTGTNQASKFPRLAVMGEPGVTALYYSYEGALTFVRGDQITYHNGTCRATGVIHDVKDYVFFGSDWGVHGLGFKQGQQQAFVQNYPYTYTTVSFEALNAPGANWPHTPIPGMALFEKAQGDHKFWPPSSYMSTLFSEEEMGALALLDENGTVTADDPEMAGVDFVALSEKINSLRVPDTNEYILNEDGTWTILKADTQTEEGGGE